MKMLILKQTPFKKCCELLLDNSMTRLLRASGMYQDGKGGGAARNLMQKCARTAYTYQRLAKNVSNAIA